MARICIDGFNLALPRGAGIATYSRNLLCSLGSLEHETQVLFSSPSPIGSSNLLNELALFDATPANRFDRALTVARRLASPLSARAQEVTLSGDVITTQVESRFPAADRVWASHDVFHSANSAFAAYRRFTHLRLGRTIATDVMHWTCPLPLIEPRMANIFTLHDLIPLRLPYTTLDNKRAYYDMCKKAVARADRVFTVSEHSRSDIIRMLGVDEDRVVNTYQSVDLPARHLQRSEDELAAELEGAFGLEPQSYFLFFGAADPKKNLPRLVEAFVCSGIKARLVIVGPKWLSEAQTRWVAGQPLEADGAPERLLRDRDRVLRFEYLPHPSLMTLIRGARATLFPSLYEGFGLPVLESMLLGAPVLTSTEGSLPEVAGDAALLVDPYDVEAIRDGIRTLDSDADLRRDLVERGHLQAAKFSPQRYRERLQEAYAPLL